MNIVKVSAHACVRVQKMALPLIDKGHNVHLIANSVPSYVENYKTFSLVNDLGQMKEALKLYDPIVDVWHCHNEPSYFVSMIKEISDKPVVLDVHDSFLARSTPEEEEDAIAKGKKRTRITTEERNNFQLADGLVFPSQSFREIVVNEFGLDQPSITLPSYLPQRLYRYDTREWLGGLVYEGRIDIKSEIDKDDRMRGFRYCDYEELAQKAKELNMDFHIYTVRKDEPFLKIYDPLAFVNPPVGMPDLIKRVSRHDWGLVGNVFPTPEWDVAFPNKLFEYIAGGVPIVAINAGECARFVRQYGIGIEVDSLEELAHRWREHRQCRANLLKQRGQWTMDANIYQLENLYERILHD